MASQQEKGLVFGEKPPEPLRAKKPYWLQKKIEADRAKKEARKAALGVEQPSIFPKKIPLCFDHNRPMEEITVTRKGKPEKTFYCPDCPRD